MNPVPTTKPTLASADIIRDALTQDEDSNGFQHTADTITIWLLARDASRRQEFTRKLVCAVIEKERAELEYPNAANKECDR